jgi:hypothetical protein
VRKDCGKLNKNKEYEIVLESENSARLALDARSQNTIRFIVDSGCSDHMVPVEYDLQKESKIEITVRVAN